MEGIDEKVLLDNLGRIAYSLDKAYLAELKDKYNCRFLYEEGGEKCFVKIQKLWEKCNNMTSIDIDHEIDKSLSVDYPTNIRAIRITRWVFDKDEKPADCFKNVLSTFADGEHSIALVVNRSQKGTEMYLVVKNEGEGRNEDSMTNRDLLLSSLKGNFPGIQADLEKKVSGFKDLCPLVNVYKSISVLSNVPSEYSEDFITQGLDKLLNGIVPEKEDDSYSIIFLAESLNSLKVREIISGYEDIATALSPYMGYQYQIGKNESETRGENQSVSDTDSITNSIFHTNSINVGVSFSGISAGYGYGWGNSKSVCNGKTNTKGKSKSLSVGSSKNNIYTYKSYLVANIIEKIENTIKRVNAGQATGLWKYATYVLANDAKSSKNIASYLRALTQGKESYIESTAIQEWSKKRNELTDFDAVKQYLMHFVHPVFGEKDKESSLLVTPTSYVGTSEISNVIVFPRKSVAGLPVLQCVQFGREPHSLGALNAELEIGNAYNMFEEQKNQRISLSLEELTKHTFITGSTGSGKSNAIYNLLEKLVNKGKTFLVVEPAKGEYKTALSNLKKMKENADPENVKVTVYGTNPDISDLLRLNPFSFPKEIHVLEHLDRLVELFNVCWPMYAAMPAILKDAMERAYKVAGWDLTKSKNKYNDSLFPTFSDVLRQIRIVLNESEYSADNKGDYIGSLVTRINSLTNGINGLIFTSNAIPDNELFDENVIVDLSRVGSTETKSLIMGILVQKLQEYRMVKHDQTNENLRHVTVLEEAHNLLKRTSTVQSSESSNLLGKSVEMLANSIAEMRTYGEGFIIADQSPDLLDKSVIRNTNTKIILRLPDYADRELVGKAAGLNDDQIVELGRLERGVAAISQSDWLEPVLCKIDEFKKTESTEQKDNAESKRENDASCQVFSTDEILQIILKNELVGKIENPEFVDKVLRSNIASEIKAQCLLEGKTPEEKVSSFIYSFFNSESALQKAKQYADMEEWSNFMIENLNPSICGYSIEQKQKNMILGLILYEQVRRDSSFLNLYQRYTDKIRKGGLI